MYFRGNIFSSHKSFRPNLHKFLFKVKRDNVVTYNPPLASLEVPLSPIRGSRRSKRGVLKRWSLYRKFKDNKDHSSWEADCEVLGSSLLYEDDPLPRVERLRETTVHLRRSSTSAARKSRGRFSKFRLSLRKKSNESNQSSLYLEDINPLLKQPKLNGKSLERTLSEDTDIRSLLASSSQSSEGNPKRNASFKELMRRVSSKKHKKIREEETKRVLYSRERFIGVNTIFCMKHLVKYVLKKCLFQHSVYMNAVNSGYFEISYLPA